MFDFRKNIIFILIFILVVNILIGEDEKINYNLKVDNVAFKENFDKLKKDTGSLFILASATAATLYILPDSFTGWDKDDDTGIFKNGKKI